MVKERKKSNMKSFRTCFFLIILNTVVSCQHNEKGNRTLADVENAFQNGNLTLSTYWSDSMLIRGKPDSITKIRLRSLVDIAGRIKADFSLSESEINHPKSEV